MIQLTHNAIDQLKSVLKEKEIVRIAVKGGGCSGMTYGLEVETEIDEEDIALAVPGLHLYIDPHSAEMLKNTTLDYVSGLQRQGFVFNNPDANTTCGCGSSFS